MISLKKHAGAMGRALIGASRAPFSAGGYPQPRRFTMRARTYSVCTDRCAHDACHRMRLQCALESLSKGAGGPFHASGLGLCLAFLPLL